jgi:protein SCO1
VKAPVAAAVLAAAVAAAGCGAAGHPSPSTRGFALDPPVEAHDFSLHDRAGSVVRLSGERSRFVLLTFLYTRCTDVCPLIAEQLNGVLRVHARDLDRTRVLAVSVDPAGDTAAAVDRYYRIHRLSARFLYLIGTRRQLARIWRAYKVPVLPRGGGHPAGFAYVLLVDPNGRGRVFYDARVTTSDVVHDIRELERSADGPNE